MLKDVIDHAVNKEILKKASAIRLEIDYELVTLSDALKAENHQETQEAKERLVALVEKLSSLSDMKE